MDPNIYKSPALALPSPSPEGGQFGASAGHAEVNPKPESLVSSPELQAAPPQVTAVPLPPALPQPLATALTTAPAQPQAVAPTASSSDDSAVSQLDEEWINKAKAIVEKTRTDPYVESRELGRVKADYLRVRYNKQIKVAEDRQQ